MSAYIVGKETIDSIVTYIHHQPIAEIESYYPAIYEAYQNGNKDPHYSPDPNKLGQKLWAMNVRAVDQRYSEKNPIEIYCFELRVARLIQTYKTLRCYLYQCSEGNVPQFPLYQDLEKLSYSIANKIISELPEYEETKWA